MAKSARSNYKKAIRTQRRKSLTNNDNVKATQQEKHSRLIELSAKQLSLKKQQAATSAPSNSLSVKSGGVQKVKAKQRADRMDIDTPQTQQKSRRSKHKKDEPLLLLTEQDAYAYPMTSSKKAQKNRKRKRKVNNGKQFDT